MRNPMFALSLSAALLIGPALPASAANPPAGTALPDRLGGLLRDLEQDQALRLTRSAGDREARFSAARPEQILQALSAPGQTALVLLGSRDARANAPLSLQRALRISGERLQAAAPAVKSAYVLNSPAEADLSALLGPMLAQGRMGGAALPLEPMSAADAIKAVNAWKGVRFIAALESSPGAPGPVLKQLVLVPDTIRISVTGAGVASAAAPVRAKVSLPALPAPPIPADAAPASEAPSSPSPTHREPPPMEADLRQHMEQIEQERAQQELEEQEKMKQEHAEWEQAERQRVEQEQIERERIELEEMEKEQLERS